jgi:hypothetical protein
MKNPQLTIVTLTRDNKSEFLTTRQSIENRVSYRSEIAHLVIDGSIKKNDLCLRKNENIETTYCWLAPSGIFNSMNFATKQIKTEYVLFLNSGDKLHEKLDLIELLRVLDESKPLWLVGRATLKRRDGTIEDWKIPKPNGLKHRLAVNSFPHQATIYRASIFDKNFSFDENSKVADWKLSLALSAIATPNFYDNYICENDVFRASGQVGLFKWVKHVVNARLEAKLSLIPNKSLETVLQFLVAVIVKIKHIKRLGL